MLKKFLIILLVFAGLAAYASDNFLNSVVISNNDGNLSVILRLDKVVKMKRESQSSDKLVLTLRGISQSPDINTLYKNTSDVKGIIIQNKKNNELKIYIEAPEISKADIVFETPNSSPLVVSNSIHEQRVIWSLMSIIILLLVMCSARKSAKSYDGKSDIGKAIKEREKALYRNFQREIDSLPSINCKLKSYRKHVLKGETLRHYSKI